MNDLTVRSLPSAQLPDALTLVWRTFCRYDAPDYTPDGIRAFHSAICDKAYLSQLSVWGAYWGDRLVGVIATRDNDTHIALFFVESSYHHQGIGRQLMAAVLRHNNGAALTVHAAPAAVPAYRHMGFRPTGRAQEENDIRYTPMARPAGTAL